MKLSDDAQIPPRDRVCQTLRKISSLFGSANDLAEAVENLGLFNGLVSWGDEEIEIINTDLRSPDSWAQEGWAFPHFVSHTEAGTWHCRIGYGAHHVALGFGADGSLVSVEPDDQPSQRCWGTDDIEKRRARVKALVDA